MDSERPRVPGKGARPEVSTAADITGPNKTRLSTQSAIDPVRMFLPGKTEAEYALRQRIDRTAIMAATAATRTSSDCARSICWATADLGSEWRIRPATEQQLFDVICILARLLAAARAIERLEAVDG